MRQSPPIGLEKPRNRGLQMRLGADQGPTKPTKVCSNRASLEAFVGLVGSSVSRFQVQGCGAPNERAGWSEEMTEDADSPPGRLLTASRVWA